jgi:hypothetical protein
MTSACNHGVVFDKAAAEKILESTPHDDRDPIAFIMGSTGHVEIRKRWPRLMGKCPLGCGFSGIAYASYEHYLYGDW